MRVCYLINQLAPGGAPSLLLDIIEQTEEKDISYTVCFIEGEDAIVSDLQRAGAEVVDFGASFKFDPRALMRMGRFFRRREFDVLHAHLPYAQTLGRLFAKFGNADSVVSTQHTMPENYHPITRWLERATRSLDDATVAVSGGVERAFRGSTHQFDGTLDGQWCTIHNGINVEEFQRAVRNSDPSSIKDGIDSDAFVFLNVARYVPVKSQDCLIKAMASVVETAPRSHLFIVGWGEREDELRELVSEQELNDNVTVTGRAISIYEYYKLANAFVLSSSLEGFGVVLLEAMAAELPIVATAIPGVSEVVNDGSTGLLVPLGDPDAMAEAMIDIRDKANQESMGTAGYERAVKNFSIDETTENHHLLYRLLISE